MASETDTAAAAIFASANPAGTAAEPISDGAQPAASMPHLFTAPPSSGQPAAPAAPAPAATVSPELQAALATIQQQKAEIAEYVRTPALAAPALPLATPTPAPALVIGDAHESLTRAFETKSASLSQWRYAQQHGTVEQKALAAQNIPALKLDLQNLVRQADSDRRLAAMEAAPAATAAAHAAREWVGQRLTPEVLTAAKYPKLAARVQSGAITSDALLDVLDLAGFDHTRAGETAGGLDRQLAALELVSPDVAPAAPAAPAAPGINPGAIAMPRNGVSVATEPKTQYQGEDWKQDFYTYLQRNPNLLN